MLIKYICPFHVTFERFVPLNSSRPNKVINDGQCGDLVYPLQMIELSTNQKTNKPGQDWKKPGSECGTKFNKGLLPSTKCDFVISELTNT